MSNFGCKTAIASLIQPAFAVGKIPIFGNDKEGFLLHI
jgi:hypothetical protein